MQFYTFFKKLPHPRKSVIHWRSDEPLDSLVQNGCVWGFSVWVWVYREDIETNILLNRKHGRSRHNTNGQLYLQIDGPLPIKFVAGKGHRHAGRPKANENPVHLSETSV